MVIVWITEFLLYICLCLLMGTLIFYSLSVEKRPSFFISKRLLLWATAGTGLLSFAPIVNTIIVMADGIGLWVSFKNVIFVFEVGQAWLFTLAMALLLFGLIYFNTLENDPFLSKIGVVLCILLIAGYARAGHASSLLNYTGFAAHFMHLLAVAVWGGCLLVAAWFTQGLGNTNWLSFLKWYTPLAIVSVIVVIAAGLLTMNIDIAKPLDHSVSSTITQYKQGLFSNYGQALLIKHILVIPLLLYALFNGFLGKRLKKYQSIKWARVESIVILFIFAVTAFMGQQPPPHQPEQYINLYGPSPLFTVIYQSKVPSDFSVHFSWTPTSLIFIGFSLLFLIMMASSVIKSSPRLVSLLMALGFLASAYFATMSAIV
ncbi:putative copper resistance protein D [Pullulanibacillus pueri]|uniref:Copper resistance protein D domain-containing protein n=1 Tax=Pullulanibacillus pueri TaxID=1437324 RepID=A0A8J3ENC3_9BACL|nr:CopD family protein [Pullulanibacillus pueri]MBM7680521.1 putative copper resistance protein D [Pullulanibacillus pueri]GGH86103.1 hypothetical protein GCM10007096_33030 [Pullulanibacillus pueri]